MGLKKRLVVAFLIILLVPMVTMSAAGFVIAEIQSRNLEMRPAQSGSAENGEEEVLFVVKNPVAGEAQVTMPILKTTVILGGIIMFTAVILVLWLYQSIIAPLNVLTKATKSIQQGNLDFTVSGNPDDELGRLCEDFEQMRVRMKDDIDTKLKYEKDTRELISNISHDLKTPLTAIKGYAEGILDGVADTDEKRERYIKTIYNKAVDMQVLVDELSFYSKIDTDIIPYDYREMDVQEFFADCADELSLDMEVKGIAMEYESTVAEGTTVIADPEQLRRVVNNLIGNSVKYMDKPEGKIRIEVSDYGKDPERYVQVSIEDNGAGIAESDLPHIFDRFFRADASRNSRKGGTGLGLAISKKIVEDQGGTIWAESTEKEGTKMMFTVPKCIPCEEQYEEIEDAEYTKVPGRIRREQERR